MLLFHRLRIAPPVHLADLSPEFFDGRARCCEHVHDGDPYLERNNLIVEVPCAKVLAGLFNALHLRSCWQVAEPVSDLRDVDEAKEALCGFVITGGDAAGVLELGETAFDKIIQPVDGAVDSHTQLGKLGHGYHWSAPTDGLPPPSGPA
jgi:hypothetical protein